eukprot:TCONS_00029059-protein
MNASLFQSFLFRMAYNLRKRKTLDNPQVLTKRRLVEKEPVNHKERRLVEKEPVNHKEKQNDENVEQNVEQKGIKRKVSLCPEVKPRKRRSKTHFTRRKKSKLSKEICSDKPTMNTIASQAKYQPSVRMDRVNVDNMLRTLESSTSEKGLSEADNGCLMDMERLRRPQVAVRLRCCGVEETRDDVHTNGCDQIWRTYPGFEISRIKGTSGMSGQIRIKQNSLKPGQKPKEEIFFFIALGPVRFSLDTGSSWEAFTGDHIVIPGGQIYSIENNSSHETRVVYFTSPTDTTNTTATIKTDDESKNGNKDVNKEGKDEPKEGETRKEGGKTKKEEGKTKEGEEQTKEGEEQTKEGEEQTKEGEEQTKEG